MIINVFIIIIILTFKMENPANFRNIKETYKIEQTIGKGCFAIVKKCKNRAT